MLDQQLTACVRKLLKYGYLPKRSLKSLPPDQSSIVEDILIEKEGKYLVKGSELHRLLLIAIEVGLSREAIISSISWKTFEEVVRLLLEINNFNVKKHLRMRHHGKQFEIDLFATKEGRALAVECKYWRRHFTNRIGKAVRDLNSKMEVLKSLQPPIKAEGILVLPLLHGPSYRVENIVVTDIFQLGDYLSHTY